MSVRKSATEICGKYSVILTESKIFRRIGGWLSKYHDKVKYQFELRKLKINTMIHLLFVNINII